MSDLKLNPDNAATLGTQIRNAHMITSTTSTMSLQHSKVERFGSKALRIHATNSYIYVRLLVPLAEQIEKFDPVLTRFDSIPFTAGFRHEDEMSPDWMLDYAHSLTIGEGQTSIEYSDSLTINVSNCTDDAVHGRWPKKKRVDAVFANAGKAEPKADPFVMGETVRGLIGNLVAPFEGAIPGLHVHQPTNMEVPARFTLGAHIDGIMMSIIPKQSS